MSLRRAAALVARGFAESASTLQSAEAGVAARLCTGASTSGRQAWPLGTAAGVYARGPAAWSAASAAGGFQGTRAAHGKSSTKYTPAELGLYWGAAAVFMVGVSYASVPLYKLFCAATGYGGTVRAGESVEEKLQRRRDAPDAKVEEAASKRELRVWFNADVADDMPWDFRPTQEYVRVRPGQSTLVFFTARNKSDKPVTGYSLYNVTPDKAAFYFNKIQCFCFEEQRLRPGEQLDMPVFFYVDPEFATDWNCRNINDITLSYVFNKVEGEDEEDAEDDGRPSVVKLHSGPHPAAVAAGLQAPGLVPVAVGAAAPPRAA
ncbi:hypothetical protein HYH02_015006 [Chlamydomonas schloesseri]|uniref:Uncharacterized protein n=1 Tax=Chlamydomonas schloesseri TaxID=2026947 RepID=A0A835SH94_9CHLO|nr:hypothetical protein HYH02_015006 [Chlamydomonas schloesseri]|eukprot:KAG2425521.1 hypothetical protein HYH02_015006 [Chlamydomonas schloesseri]